MVRRRRLVTGARAPSPRRPPPRLPLSSNFTLSSNRQPTPTKVAPPQLDLGARHRDQPVSFCRHGHRGFYDGAIDRPVRPRARATGSVAHVARRVRQSPSRSATQRHGPELLEGHATTCFAQSRCVPTSRPQTTAAGACPPCTMPTMPASATRALATPGRLSSNTSSRRLSSSRVASRTNR